MFISSAYRCAIRSAGSLTLGMVRRVARPLVCIPTYDEVSNILALVERVHEAAPEADVLVVDDASPDGTGDVVRTQILKDARLEIMARPAKLGLGTAYMAGFAYGLQHGYASVLTMDADFSHPPDRIPALIAAVDGGAHLSGGSRFIPRGRIQGRAARPPVTQRHRQFRGATSPAPSHPRLHRRLPLLQSSRLAVHRDPAA